jgi:hypothetical protein
MSFSQVASVIYPVFLLFFPTFLIFPIKIQKNRIFTPQKQIKKFKKNEKRRKKRGKMRVAHWARNASFTNCSIARSTKKGEERGKRRDGREGMKRKVGKKKVGGRVWDLPGSQCAPVGRGLHITTP